ncbi:MAG: sulfite exporter TauE/SafE family protein [Pseudomonadota bacterium]
MVVALVLGTTVGIVMGLTGAGGGILAVPLLVFGMHLTVTQAGPVGLLAVGIAAGVGALLGLKSKIVRYRAALLIAAAGIVSALAGLWLAHRLDTRLMSLAFAVVLVWVAYKSFRESTIGDLDLKRRRPAQPCIRNTGSGQFMWTAKCAGALSVSGGIAGALSGLLGVGGGFVMVPALQRYTDLEAKSVVATSLAVISLISLTGVITSMSTGDLDGDVALPFALGSVGGMIIGSLISSRLPPKYLKLAFALICLLVAAGMVIKAL